jgi:hypothetical protein
VSPARPDPGRAEFGNGYSLVRASYRLDFADTAAIRVFLLAARTLRLRGGDLVLLRPQGTLALARLKP